MLLITFILSSCSTCEILLSCTKSFAYPLMHFSIILLQGSCCKTRTGFNQFERISGKNIVTLSVVIGGKCIILLR